MSIENVTAMKPVLTQPPKIEETEQKVSQLQIEMKDGKKKLTLALAGLATAGVVTAGVVYGIKTGKLGKAKQIAQEQAQNIQQDVPELTQKPKEKIKGLVRGKNIPYTNNNNKLQGKIVDKYEATFGEQEVIVEHKIKRIPNKGVDTYAIIRSKDSGEIVTTRRVDLEGNEIPFLNSNKSEGIHKISQTSLEEGKQVRKTFKNGKLHSTQTTILNPDGSKRIVVDYEPSSHNVGQTIIDIAKDGTRKIVQEAENILKM